MSSSESMEALSDPLPRIYSCFCDKIFTTYPGIYLHLKSKHSNLFQKYKKLKITKLFKKIKGQNNSDIFKLDKLSEKEISNSNFYFKKIKQNNKKINALSDEKIVLLEEDSNQEIQKKRSNHAFNNSLDQRPPDLNFPSKNFPQSPRDFLERMGNSPYYPPMPNPFFSFPYYPPPPNFPPFPFPFAEPSIKRIIQEFLDFYECSDLNLRKSIRNILYRVIIFIDENYASIEDPRVNGAVLLSYCDAFSPKFIGPLLRQYIEQKTAHIKDDNHELQRTEIGYLEQFMKFLSDRRLLREQPENKLDHSHGGAITSEGAALEKNESVPQ